MGSRATHTRSALGGLDGRALRAGDRLAIAAAAPQDDVAIEAPWLAWRAAPFGVVLGPQDDHFAAAAIDAFLEATYTLTAQADRMAYKLEGPKIAHARGHDIVSDGVALGAIQVAGDGQPMVLMADRQPTGGYTKLAHVCRADIGRLAQLAARRGLPLRQAHARGGARGAAGAAGKDRAHRRAARAAAPCALCRQSRGHEPRRRRHARRLTQFALRRTTRTFTASLWPDASVTVTVANPSPAGRQAASRANARLSTARPSTTQR